MCHIVNIGTVRIALNLIFRLFNCSLQKTFFFSLRRHHCSSPSVYSLHNHAPLSHSLFNLIHCHCHLDLTEIVPHRSCLFPFSNGILKFRVFIAAIVSLIWVLFSRSWMFEHQNFSLQFRILLFQFCVFFPVGCIAFLFGFQFALELLYLSLCYFKLRSQGVGLVEFFLISESRRLLRKCTDFWWVFH